MLYRIGLCASCASLAVLTGCTSLQDRIGTLEEKSAVLEQRACEQKQQADELKKQAGELKKQTDALAAQIAAAKDEQTVKLNELFEVYWDSNYGRLNPILAQRYLNSIQLPEKPGEKDINAFLGKLYGLRRVNSDNNFTDLVAARIAEVGKDNIEMLIPYMEYSPFVNAFLTLGGNARKDLLKRAISQQQNRSSELVDVFVRLAEPGDAEYILATLSAQPRFIEGVKKLKLEKQVLPILTRRLLDSADGNRSFNHETDWLRVALETMTPAEREAFLAPYWNKMRKARNGDWYLRERGALLAENGFLPAFLYLGENYSKFNGSDVTNALVALSPCETFEDFVVWFRENRKNLVFDTNAQLYRPAPKKAAEPVKAPEKAPEKAAEAQK